MADCDDPNQTSSFKEASPNANSDKRGKQFDERDLSDDDFDAASSAIPLKQSEIYGRGLLMTNSNLHEGMENGSLMGDVYDHHNGGTNCSKHRLFQKLSESHLQNIDRSSMVHQITQGL